MDRDEAIELLKNMHWSITTKMNREVPSSLALLMAIKALGEDIDAPSKSALDHIHNVVRDDAYKRGYEDGKKDAIPIDWIKAEIKSLKNENSYTSHHLSECYKALLLKWKRVKNERVQV